jgi:hypothetical protein
VNEISEKAENVFAWGKYACKHNVNPRFKRRGKSSGKAGKCRKKSGFIPTFPVIFRKQLLKKFWRIRFD